MWIETTNLLYYLSHRSYQPGVQKADPLVIHFRQLKPSKLYRKANAWDNANLSAQMPIACWIRMPELKADREQPKWLPPSQAVQTIPASRMLVLGRRYHGCVHCSLSKKPRRTYWLTFRFSYVEFGLLQTQEIVVLGHPRKPLSTVLAHWYCLRWHHLKVQKQPPIVILASHACEQEGGQRCVLDERWHMPTHWQNDGPQSEWLMRRDDLLHSQCLGSRACVDLGDGWEEARHRGCPSHDQCMPRGFGEGRSRTELSGIESRGIGVPPGIYQQCTSERISRYDWGTYALKFSVLAQALSLIGFDTGADVFGIVPTLWHASLLAD